MLQVYTYVVYTGADQSGCGIISLSSCIAGRMCQQLALNLSAVVLDELKLAIAVSMYIRQQTKVYCALASAIF